MRPSPPASRYDLIARAEVNPPPTITSSNLSTAPSVSSTAQVLPTPPKIRVATSSVMISDLLSRGDRPRDILVLCCAISAGIHGALARDHFAERTAAGIGFALSAVLLAAFAVL